MSRPINLLTAGGVKALKGRDKIYRELDGGGLYITVKPNGSKYWTFRYKTKDETGKLKDNSAGFGSYSDVTLAEARRKAEKARKDLTNGITPQDRKRKDEMALAEERRLWGSTFGSVAREWYRYTCTLEGKNQPWTNDKHKAQVIKTLETYAFPAIGKVAIAELKAKDIRKVTDALKNDGKWETAQRVFQRISMVCDAAIEEELIGSNPCDFLRRKRIFKNRPEKGHFKSIRPEQLKELVKAIPKAELQPMTEQAVWLSLLLAARPVELRSMEWSEIDFDNRAWIVPAHKMKMRRTHLVPLADSALRSLHKMEALSGRNKYVFPHRSKGHTPMSEGTVNMAIKRMKLKNRTTAHGFRALFSTWAYEAKVYRRDVIETQLSHLVGSKVERHYNFAEYKEERVELMDDWAEFVEAAGVDNVTSLAGRRKA
jgi:integrase